MREKIIGVGDWDFGVSPSSLVKISSRGLIGHDRFEFFKRAAAQFQLDMDKLASDETPVHLIAMGSTEFWGANRNFDGFKEAMLKRCHPTFVSNAHNFRNHANKDPKKSYGEVKAAHYNEDMHRVELLISFYNTKEAAEKRGKLYAGDKVLSRLHNGDDVPFSMAIRVPYDTCNNCFNKAASRAEYCTQDTCVSPTGKRRGGCRENLGKLASDGFLQYVDNPDGTFFDISHLVIGDGAANGRPADRTAYGGVADYLKK